MDEGSALLHHLERKFNRWLCSVAIGNTTTTTTAVVKDTKCHDNGADNTETLAVCGSEGISMEEVIAEVKVMVDGMNCANNHSHRSRTSVSDVALQLSQMDDGIDDFRNAKYLLIVSRVQIFQSEQELTSLLSAYRQAKRYNCSVLLLVVMETDDLSILNSVIRSHPELRILYCTKRIYTVAKQRATSQLLQQASPVLRDWLSGVLPDDTGALEQLDYPDIFKIVVRDLQRTIPGLEVFLRLTALVVGGLAAVLFTVIIIALISKETQLTLDVRQGRQRLQSVLESQRVGRSEWGWRDTPSAIIALQLNDPSWCFSSESSRRSADQMEIRLLSEISRRHQLDPSTMAAYINALLAIYQDPRSFHGNDLVSTLFQFMEERAFRTQYDNFLYGSYVTAMFNAGLQLDRKHVTRLLERQRKDGSFPLGAEEAAMTLLALTQFDEGHVPRDRFDLTLEYLMRQRKDDHSFGGSILVTAFVVQIANSTLTKTLTPADLESTVNWLLQQTDDDVTRVNVHLAGNLLMALNGKSLVSIREHAGFATGNKGVALEGFSIYVAGQDGMPPPRGLSPLSRLLVVTGGSNDGQPEAVDSFASSVQGEKEESVTKQQGSSDDNGSPLVIVGPDTVSTITSSSGEQQEQPLATTDNDNNVKRVEIRTTNQGYVYHEATINTTPTGARKSLAQPWKSVFLPVCMEREFV